ncbi:hypothetical protein [Variovorax sp. PAMC26660]|uniref:hypothetical protein n=1 Tax=Variovorax sp. PAMC26660 TaxID=2762322 RepID=UPI00164D0F82|nr:hypothetical protein [Variovorax sp. PAMC26660]QNK66857.1 hypothetical protein H7F35_27360 [Variovorax sp. PAMC26660]
MLLQFALDHREVVLNTGGSFYLKTTHNEVFIARSPDASWWPHHQAEGKQAGVFTAFGWQLTYDKAPEQLGHRPGR